jgi:chromate reductase
MAYQVGFIVGSLSRNSINRRLARALQRLAPEDLELVEIPIRELPLYNHDYDSDFPAVGSTLKSQIESVDAVLFVTPEYNRSVPGALKNAIDWATRPWGSNSLDAKPVAVIGASPGAISTAVAQQHLKNILTFTNSPVLGQPEAYIQHSEGLFGDQGEVSNQETATFLSTFLNAFHSHIKRNLG